MFNYINKKDGIKTTFYEILWKIFPKLFCKIDRWALGEGLKTYLRFVMRRVNLRVWEQLSKVPFTGQIQNSKKEKIDR